MRHRRLLPTALGFLALTSASPLLHAAAKFDLDRRTPVPANEPIPVADFFRTPLMTDPVLNPAGTHLAATVAAGEDQTSLMVLNVKTQHVETLGSNVERDVYGARWLSDNRVMYQISVRKTGSTGMYASEVGALSSTYPLLQFVGAHTVAIPHKDRSHPLVQLAPGSRNTGKYAEVAVLDTDSRIGVMQDLLRPVSDQQAEATRVSNEQHILKRFPILATPTRFALSYIADREGKLAYGTTSTDGVLNLHRFEGNSWQVCPQDLDEVEFIGPANNPGEIVIVAARQDAKPRPLQIVEAATGKVSEVLLQDTTYDFNGSLYRDPASQAVVGGVFHRARPEMVWFNEAYRGLQKAVDGLFPGMVVQILGGDESGKIVLISTSSDRQSPVYSWVDLEKHTAGLIQNSRPWLDPKRMQPMGMIKFKTRDGHRLDAYLTMPAGASKQNPPPLVVLPHSTANSRDSWTFNALTQFLASRGYAVLQPNYRGSPGYNWMFPVEDEWDFRKMREDVTDATKTLAGSGLVDPQRIAIMGSDFAGYLALAGVAFDPELYKCAIALAPVCDWARRVEDQKYSRYSDSTYSRLVRKLGDPKAQPEKFDAISPLRHAGSIKAAVLVAWGEYMPAPQISQIKDFVSAVRHNQVPVESIGFLNETSELTHLDHKVEFYQRVESFLATHLRTGAAR